jgi:hypothetical protein
VAGLCAAGTGCHREADPTETVVIKGGPPLREVTCQPAAVTIPVNGQASLKATVEAELGFTDRTVTWSRNNSRSVVVSPEGVATGVSVGFAAAIATAHADSNVKGACAVTVVAP